MKNKVCIVEDDKNLSQKLCACLSRAGFTPSPIFSLEDALRYIADDFSVWVINMTMPDGNGMDLIQKIKSENPECSVIIISSKGDCFDRLTGFKMGCDDYIPKPLLPEELVYRIDKLLHIKIFSSPQGKNDFSAHPYEIDSAKRIISCEGSKIPVTSKEFDIILYFINHKGQAVSREQLLSEIWKARSSGNTRIIDNYIKNIRKKLPKLSIETIYGGGYRYNI